MLKRLIVAASVLQLVGASSASAIPSGCGGSETHLTGPFPFSSLWTISIPFSLQGFDPACGTLTGVSVTTDLEFSGDDTVTNLDMEPSTLSDSARLVGFTGGQGLWNVTDHYLLINFGLVPPGESKTIHFNEAASNRYPGPGDPLPEFVTPGLVSATFDAYLALPLCIPCGVITAAQVDSLSVQVFYEYEPVPEPASLLLLGVGVAGLVAKRPRARRT